MLDFDKLLPDLSLYPASFRSLHRGRRPGYRLQLQGKGGESSL